MDLDRQSALRALYLSDRNSHRIMQMYEEEQVEFDTNGFYQEEEYLAEQERAAAELEDEYDIFVY